MPRFETYRRWSRDFGWQMAMWKMLGKDVFAIDAASLLIPAFVAVSVEQFKAKFLPAQHPRAELRGLRGIFGHRGS